MNSMTISKKLFWSFGAALALTIAVSVVSLLGFSTLSTNVDKLIKVNARKVFLGGEVNTAVSDFMAESRGILVRSFMKDPATAAQYNRDFGETVVRMKKRLDEYNQLVETAEARQMLAELQSDTDQIAQYNDDLFRLVTSDKIDAAADVYKGKLNPLAKSANAVAERLVTHEQALMAAVGKSSEASVSQSRQITGLMIVLSLGVAAMVVFIVRQINHGLRQTVAQLSEGAEQTASAASQVSSSSQSLAQGSSEQAASLEETSASSEEINSMARKNTENSRSAADLVTQSQEKFTETNQSLEQMVTAMGEIKASSDKISKIIKTIDEIAFQTNILALNAAVEAARAGEAGMGFAVVADEVRNLAQRCAQAAKDTADLIEESIAKSNDGTIKVDQVAVAIRTISEESHKVKMLVDEVNLGSQEQARGIDQIGKALTQMEQVTQGTAANAEESAAAAEELNAQSETLKDVVQRLAAMVGASESVAVTRRTGAKRKKVAAAASVPAPARRMATVLHNRRPSGSGISALRSAVANKALGPAPAHDRNGFSDNPGSIDKSSFPMDDEFKEFTQIDAGHSGTV
jgi:methyl-accepting chemotaxis protein